MAKAKKKDPITLEREYIAFLEKRLASENYKAKATPEEFAATKEKLGKSRFKLKTLLMSQGKKK